MSAQSPFILPLRGLGQGVYVYDLTADDDFFATFKDSPVTEASVQLQLTVDRRTREMTLDFDFTGTVATDCDRCLAPINLPVEDRGQMVIKFRADADQLEDNDEVIYLDPDTSLFNVAPYAYEMILLAVPMVKTYACREGASPYPCDDEMLDRIDASVDYLAGDSEHGNDDDEDKPSPWDVLKDLQ
ncbi:MAG: DUF177 domain-containing protein [Bacteroidota bacterium]